jgi:ABC-type lipoprotein release transport system permease subunit
VNVSLHIAKRYLFAKKSHNIINIISIVSFFGVAVATAVLFIVLSIFNGLQNFVEQSFNSFSADIEITPKYGKIIQENAIDLKQIASLDAVEYLSEVLSDVAVFVHDDKQFIAKIKGVYSDYSRMNRLDTIVRNGEFILENRGFPFAVLGVGVASHLNCPVSTMLSNNLKIYYPDRNKKNVSSASIDALNPQVISPSGIFYSLTEYDAEFVFVPISFARTLLGYETGYTSLEIRCKSSAKVESIQNEIKKRVGEEFYVKNAYQQEEELFKVMQSEKWITYVILAFILLIASFNMVGMLAILILEKKQTVGILYSMGADIGLVRRIFIYEGMLISILGVVIGLLLGFIFCLLQMQFGFITFGEGSYLLTAYPVLMQWKDVFLVPLIVLLITIPSAYFLARRIYPKLSMR